MDYSTVSVHFLDTTVILKENQLQTSLYRKPTGRYSNLLPESCHPPHIKTQLYTAKPYVINAFVLITPINDRPFTRSIQIYRISHIYYQQTDQQS